MDVSDPLDIRDLIQKTSQNTLVTGLVLMFAIPAALYGVGWFISRMNSSGAIPTLIWVIIALSFGFGLLVAWGGVSDKGKWQKHDAVKWSGIGTPEEVLQSIEEEWRDTPASQKFKVYDYFLTPHWLLHINSTTIESYPLRSIVWAYSSSTKRYVNGVPVGTTNKVIVQRSDSKLAWSFSVLSDAMATELLFALQKRAPWGFYGHTEAYYHGWKREHDAFVAAVGERYHQVQSGQIISTPETQFQAEVLGAHSENRAPAEPAKPLPGLDL